jgi:hypothetical protein
MRDRTVFVTEQNSSNRVLDIRKAVSRNNITGYGTLPIPEGRPFIYIVKGKYPGIYTCGNILFIFLSFRKNSEFNYTILFQLLLPVPY